MKTFKKLLAVKLERRIAVIIAPRARFKAQSSTKFMGTTTALIVIKSQRKRSIK